MAPTTAKAAQVLLPGGRLAPFHHVFQAPPEVTQALAQAHRRDRGSFTMRYATVAVTAARS